MSRFVEGIKSGHIRGAINIPQPLFIDSGTNQMKSADAIRAVFKEAGVDLDTVSIVASCGGGELCNDNNNNNNNVVLVWRPIQIFVLGRFSMVIPIKLK